MERQRNSSHGRKYACARRYAEKFLSSFSGQDDKAQKFLHVMRDFNSGNDGALARMKDLLEGRADLVMGLNFFLPKGFEIPVDEFPANAKEAVGFVDRVLNLFRYDENIFETFLDLITLHRSKREGHQGVGKLCDKLSSILGDHRDLTEEFRRFGPVFEALNVTGSVSQGKRKADLLPAGDLTADHAGIGEDTVRTGVLELENVPYTDLNGDTKQDGFEVYCERRPVFCEKVRKKLSSDDYLQFLNYLYQYSRRVIGKTDLQDAVGVFLGKYPGLMDDFNGFLDKMQNHGVKSATEKNEEERKFIFKSIHELDLSECDNCSPSYWCLPEEYPVPCSSGRTEFEAEVLNDHLVCRPSGTVKDFSKSRQLSALEKSVLRCEEDRCSMDVLIESYRSAVKHALKLLNRMNEGTTTSDTQINIQDYFTAQNLRCIENLYAEHSLNALETLQENPHSALPVITDRLKQKVKEFRRGRSHLQEIWAEVALLNLKQAT